MDGQTDNGKTMPLIFRYGGITNKQVNDNYQLYLVKQVTQQQQC